MFSKYTRDPVNWSTCLEKITRILVAGDSADQYMFPNLISLFIYWKCVEVRRSDTSVTADDNSLH